MMNPEQERAEQLREGLRLARDDGDDAISTFRPRLSTRRDYEAPASRASASLGRSSSRAKPATAPKGHEAFLKALHESGAEIRVYLLDLVEPLQGKIRATDKYTISLDVKGTTEVIFKHAIQRFSPLPRPRVQPAPAPADTTYGLAA
jgi:RNA chaperone Hfq